MKIRRKTNRCLNCFVNIDQIYNFCPNCGQENTNRNVSFKDLVREFFNNYLSFDSKFGRSIKPFFFNPGKLTNEFISGRRVNYANPIRLYLILSLFYFFALSQFNAYKNTDEGSGNISISVPNKVSTAVADSIANAPELYIEETTDNESIFPFQTKQNLAKFLKYQKDLIITDSQLFDSLYIEDMSAFDKLALKQTIRIGRAKNKEMVGYIIEQMPLLMFIMLPIFALVMKLLYIRRKQNYIIHLVHSLHQHSFKFFILGIATVVGIFTSQSTASYLIGSAFLISLVYILLSFKNVYKQGFLKTFFKFGIYYFIYMVLLIFGLSIEMLISLALY